MSTAKVFKIVKPYTPELLLEVQLAIEEYIHLLDYDPVVLEFGSGYSTIWLAKQTINLISVEHNREWWLEVDNRLQKENLNPWYLHLSSIDLYRVHLFLSHKYPLYDLVLVDCIDEERIACIKSSIPFLKIGGWLVVDDSHWDMFQGVFEKLSEELELVEVYKGDHKRKTGEVAFHQTSIFRKK